MNDALIVDLVLWFVVYPLLLIAAVVVYRAVYRTAQRNKREKERLEALQRIDAQRETTRATWKRNDTR